MFTNGCPVPVTPADTVALAHGGGGRLTRQLIEQVFLPLLDNPALRPLHDGAVVDTPAGRLAFTTDGYVVHPPVFPGGDIGTLAVHGTVNDLAMCGARPLALSAGLILEEGCPMDLVKQAVASMRRAADRSGVSIVTGDTKVVDRGKADGIFITTSGIGLIECAAPPAPARIQSGDAILVNGDLGRHGIAIMAIREGLTFETTIESDTAPLADLVQALLRGGIDVHCLRDLTRGGLASALIELSASARVAMTLNERAIPISEEVHGACEILGLDPLYVANEGRCAAIVPASQAEAALAIMRGHPEGAGAARIGVVADGRPRVTVIGALGEPRLVELFSGEQLPRIC
jgi:hydrogenase expression/formation protein HypE